MEAKDILCKHTKNNCNYILVQKFYKIIAITFTAKLPKTYICISYNRKNYADDRSHKLFTASMIAFFSDVFSTLWQSQPNQTPAEKVEAH